MIRAEIKKLAELAQDIHNFQQGVQCSQGYYARSCRNYYTTRDGKIRIAQCEWTKDMIVAVADQRRFGLSALLGPKRRFVHLTDEEQTLVKAIYDALEQTFRRDYVKPEDSAILAAALAKHTTPAPQKLTPTVEELLNDLLHYGGHTRMACMVKGAECVCGWKQVKTKYQP